MRFFPFAAACLLAATAHAQTTWANLSFGQTRDDVRSTLSTQSFAVENSADGSLQSTSDYQLLLPGMRAAFPLRADFHFTDAGRLVNIVLTLDVNAMRENFSWVGNDEAMLMFAAQRLGRALSDKYGPAIDIADDCHADAAALAKNPVHCEVNYRGADQSVELDWVNHPHHLYIRYQMLSPDL